MPRAPRHAAQSAQTLVRQGSGASQVRTTEAAKLVAFVRERMAHIAASFFDVGEALTKLRDKALYAALGHTSFDALLGDLGFSKAQAYRFIGIAQRMTRQQATELGPRRAVALLRLTSATPGDDSVAEVLRKGVTLPGRKAALPVRALTADQIEDAARTIARAHLPLRKRIPADDAARAHDRAAALRAHLDAAGVSEARVSTHHRGRRDERERLMLRLDLPFDALPHLAAALHATARPASEKVRPRPKK